MHPMTLLQVTHVEQRLVREAAAAHNLAVQARPTRAPRQGLLARVAGHRPAPAPAACATC